MQNATRVLFYSSLVILAIYVVGSVFPSHYTWGFHYFAFFPLWFSALMLCAALAVCVSPVRLRLLEGVNDLAGLGKRLPPTVVLLILLALWVGSILLFNEKLHLMGDSGFILALTPKRPSIDNLNANFRNQPLTYEAIRLVQWMIGGGYVVEPESLYRVVDLITGAGYLLMVVYFVRRIDLSPVDALIVGGLLIFRSQNLFFFGYVENYMIYYDLITAYLITGWLALEGKLSGWIPFCIALVIPGFHYAGAFVLPSAVFLLLPHWKTHRKRILRWSAGVAVAALVCLLAWGAPRVILQRIYDAVTYDVLPLTTPRGGVPYGLFSVDHLIDWINELVHVSPFGLIVVAVGLFVVPWETYRKSPVFIFLFSMTYVGLLASFVLAPGLGYARDWDSFSLFFCPLRFLMVYFLVGMLAHRKLRHAILLIAVLSFLRWIGWIGVNTDRRSELARAEILTVPELSGTFPTLYYEQLGAMFYKMGRFDKATKWYERYVSIDSTHPRILANLSDCYKRIGDTEGVFQTLRRAVDAQSTNPGVYSDLALDYMARGDTTRALGLLLDALRINPNQSLIHANLSQIYLTRHDYGPARTHASTAIGMGLARPFLFRTVGYASYQLHDDSSAVRAFQRYLASVPSDAGVLELLKKIEGRPGTGKTGRKLGARFRKGGNKP